jgi:tetratricopeptide (TPR) repeat protein
MTCSTCHNPHDVPRGEQAAAHYNAACAQMPCGRAPREWAATAVAACHAAPPGRRCGSRGDDGSPHPAAKPRDLVAARRKGRWKYRGEVTPYYPEKDAGGVYIAVAQVRDGANVDRGIPRLREAIERLKPTQPEFYLELAKAYSKAGNPTEAVRWCDEALRLRLGFVPAMQERGAALIAAGHLPRAAEALRGVGGSVAQTNLGNVYLRLGQADAAEQALRANPDDPNANNLLGMAASQKGDNSAAEQFFRKALQLQTDHAEAHHNLANLLATNHNYPQAAYHFQQAIAANPGYAEAHYRFGLLLLASGSIDRAQRELEETVRLKPGLAEAHRDRRHSRCEGTRREAAIEYGLARKAGTNDARGISKAMNPILDFRIDKSTPIRSHDLQRPSASWRNRQFSGRRPRGGVMRIAPGGAKASSHRSGQHFQGAGSEKPLPGGPLPMVWRSRATATIDLNFGTGASDRDP